MHAQRIALGLIMAGGFAQSGCSTVSNRPETLSKGPETVSKGPETVSTAPEAVSKGPETSSKRPAKGATEIVYSGGRAIQDFSIPLTNVGNAVTEAMADLKLTAIQPGRDGVCYKIQAKTEDNRTVMVTLRPHQMQTRVGCRVGLFGDEPLTVALLERTGIRLGILPPAPIPEHVPSSPGSNPFFAKSAVPDAEMLRDVVEAPYRDRVVP
jgi:hypothetical protein